MLDTNRALEAAARLEIWLIGMYGKDGSEENGERLRDIAEVTLYIQDVDLVRRECGTIFRDALDIVESGIPEGLDNHVASAYRESIRNAKEWIENE